MYHKKEKDEKIEIEALCVVLMLLQGREILKIHVAEMGSFGGVKKSQLLLSIRRSHKQTGKSRTFFI